MIFVASAGGSNVILIESENKSGAEDYARLYFGDKKFSVSDTREDDVSWFKLMGIKTFAHE